MMMQRMVHWFCLAMAVLFCLAGTTLAQSAADVTKLIERMMDQDSIDLCKFEVKYRAGQVD